MIREVKVLRLYSKRVFKPGDSGDGKSQMGEYATGSRDFDESLRGFRQALMVASETTPARDPAKGAFNNPAPGLDVEAPLGRLGLWLGLHRGGIRSRPQPLHGLHVPTKLLFDPLKKLAPVMTITPNQLESGKAPVQGL